MKKIRKIVVLIPLMLILACFLTGCAKIVKEEESTVQVEITDEYYRDSYVTPMYTGKSYIYISHPETYYITVQYNGEEYSVSGEAVYEKYHDKIGETANATLKTTTWDNGNVVYDIVDLEWWDADKIHDEYDSLPFFYQGKGEIKYGIKKWSFVHVKNFTIHYNPFVYIKDENDIISISKIWIEVLHAICVARGYLLDELEAARKNKTDKKGGFCKKIYLESTTEFWC